MKLIISYLKTITIFVIFLATFTSSRSKTEFEPQQTELEEKVQLLKEVSLLTGKVSAQGDVRANVFEAIEEVGFGNTITFAFFLVLMT